MRPCFDGEPPVLVELTEWANIGPATDSRLRDLSFSGDGQLRALANKLRGRLDVRQSHEGIEIGSTSFVGRVDFGPLRIAVGPKLPTIPLATLLRFAYGLRNVSQIDETQLPAIRHGLQDLLISLLAAEVEELLYRGLTRRYASLIENLESPRGRILVDQVIRRGGIREARLPCRHFERRTDWHLNRVVRSGIEAAAKMTEDRQLRRRVHQLAAMFDEIESIVAFGSADIDRAERELTRMTAAYRPALTIIRLLIEALGISFDGEKSTNRMPGFLFDMNIFFQRLLSRFFRENLTVARIADELPIRGLFSYAAGGNPKPRRAPAPRPDYALFHGKELQGFLDAKYRDIWATVLPAEWLYQLSIYALASPGEVSVLLYASMSPQAQEERVEVRQPVSWSNKRPALVIVRPVPLTYLAELLEPDRARSLTDDRRRLADALVASPTYVASTFAA